GGTVARAARGRGPAAARPRRRGGPALARSPSRLARTAGHGAGIDSGFRASIVARARYVEDVLADSVAAGVGQFVVLGAGLDSVAQRPTDLAPPLQVFEAYQPGPQTWTRAR